MKCLKYLHQSLPPQLSILRASRLHHMFLGVMSSLPGRRAAAPAAAVPAAPAPRSHGRAPAPRPPPSPTAATAQLGKHGNPAGIVPTAHASPWKEPYAPMAPMYLCCPA